MTAPAAVYGLEVPCGDIIVPAVSDFPATFRITMAAIDPSAPAELVEGPNGEITPRATLKIIRQPVDMDDDDEDGDSDDEEYLQALLAGSDEDDEDDDESSGDEEEKNGGPSDPSKTKKARKEKAIADLKKALEEEDDMDIDLANGTVSKSDKGKAVATGEEEDSDDDDSDSEDLEIEEFVLCTLDPAKNYQQPLDITINEHEQVYFKVSGTHAVYLTGNYMIPSERRGGTGRYDSDEDDDEAGYDLSPDEDELDDEDEEDESDELDDLDDPRIEELVTDEEEAAPQLVKSKAADTKKGKNKRVAEDDSINEPANLDDIMAKSLKPAEATAVNGEQKLSKKQLKKLKNNAGNAVAAATTDAKKENAKTDDAGSKDKKVQFAKELEQGPTGSSPAGKDTKDGKADPNQPSLGVKVVQGVTIDDKKLGAGPVAKKGNKVEMRYIGKLQSNGLQFDANKSGPPFAFKLGVGEVIKGWDIGIAGMSAGGERRITIPAHLAYGKRKTGQIPANSTLVFDVKLLRISK